MSVIRIHRLSKQFGKRQALDDVSLEIQSSEMVGLIGASGSGKSTLLRHVSALTLAEGGSVTVDGIPVQRDGRAAYGDCARAPALCSSNLIWWRACR